MKSYHQITPVKHQEHHAVGTYGKDEIGIATDSFILVLGYYWEEQFHWGTLVHYKLYWLGENCETPEIKLTEDYKSNLKNWVENRSRNRHGQKGYKHEVVDIKDMIMTVRETINEN
jgi:hypothetical protein